MFFEYRQNNSFGWFEEDDSVAQVVIIEADNHTEANEIAESVGIYFNGCSQMIDCDCCGDRWYAQYSDEDGDEVPSHHRVPIGEEEDNDYSYLMKAIIYHKDKEKEITEVM